MDILREASDAELKFIISNLSKRLPYTIKDLHYMLAAERTKKLAKNYENISLKIQPKFYVPREGLRENCTIFGITHESDQAVWFFTLQENLDELRKCLQETKLINWNKRILFVTIHREHTSPIFDLVSDVEDYPAPYFYFTLKDALKLNVE